MHMLSLRSACILLGICSENAVAVSLAEWGLGGGEGGGQHDEL